MSTRQNSARGFSLLEVMVALGILALALTAIIQINGTSIASHGWSKRVTVGTMLARSKMVDLESQFNEEGFTSDFDQKIEGDFSEEGWEEYRWRAEIKKPDLDAASATGMVTQLIEGMVGAGDDSQGSGPSAPTSPLEAGMGQMGPMIEAQVTQLSATIEKSVREVRLQVIWKEGSEEETIDVATHFVILGPAANAVPGGTP